MTRTVFSSVRWVVLLGALTGAVAARAQTGMTAQPLMALPLKLAWSPAKTGVSGYAIYYGPTNQPATNRINTGRSTTATLTGLRADVGYRIYAVSYNGTGQESTPSNELRLVPPALSRFQLTRLADGSMQLSGKAAPGSVCTVQYTPGLNPPDWRTLAHATADDLGNVVVRDASAPQAQSRFYRVTAGALPLLGAISMNRQASGNVLLSAQAPPGATCRVLYTSAPGLNNWQTLAYLTADANGNLAALDYTARFANQRFYRMALP